MKSQNSKLGFHYVKRRGQSNKVKVVTGVDDTCWCCWLTSGPIPSGLKRPVGIKFHPLVSTTPTEKTDQSPLRRYRPTTDIHFYDFHLTLLLISRQDLSNSCASERKISSFVGGGVIFSRKQSPFQNFTSVSASAPLPPVHYLVETAYVRFQITTYM